MKVITAAAETIELGITETTPTIGITDYSRRVTDDFGVTTVVKRGFARTMSVRCALPTASVDAVTRTFTALRATPSQWVADERLSWLNFTGFYKDFQPAFSVGAMSYYTLTVEGLAETETVADTGEDPAPTGASTLLLLQPVEITAAKLIASSVAENDYPAWSAGATYAEGARVIVAAAHRVYESAVAGNVGNDPAGASGLWLDIGPTNRWAMFDQALGTVTSAAASITVTIAPGAVDALALLDVVGATVRVQTTGYDRTIAVGEGPVTLLDLPGASANILVTISGPGTVSVGTLLVGSLASLGITGDEPSTGITDYSRKNVDDFGEVTVVPRSWAKRMDLRALIRTDALDIVANRIAAVRATPALWIAKDGVDALTVYGFFKDFSIEVDQTVSTVSLSVEGLSEAAPLSTGLPPPNWTDIVDNDPVAQPKPEDGATVGAPTGTPVGDRPAETLTDQVDGALQDVADLIETYGDTASAAASAGAAALAEANAAQARDDAQAASFAADAARIAAVAAQNTADASATDSEASRLASEAAQTASETARNQAQTAATNADGSATAAAGSASTASTKATDAGNSAAAAAASATTATTKAGDAAGSATAAATSASSAGTSATNAGNSATAANAAKVAAESARDDADDSATAAAGSASTASTKATEAGTSAGAAQTAATTATTKAGEASTSAGQAATSATNAAGSASTASTQATNAANSATAAGGSATAAAGSASTASTKATEAGNSATSASGSANTATTKAGEAAGSASAAAGSASAASTSATNASNSASAASSSAVSAKSQVVKTLPSDFTADGAYFCSSFAGSPETSVPMVADADIGFVDVAGVGRVLQRSSTAASRDVSPIGVIAVQAGRTYRVSARHRVLTGTRPALFIMGTLDASYAYTPVSGNNVGVTSTTAWQTTTLELSGDVMLAAGAIYFRPVMRFNAGASVGQVAFIRGEDVSESLAAAGSASAAATSASTAATKATEAGSSASAAAGSATTASTAAGTATTKASEASTSATNAAGSASTASTQATNAANSASAAGGSATAAAGSASAASTQATNASNSATAANTAKVAAESARDNASSSASAASGSAATASTQAGVATTQAGLAAGYKDTAQTQAGISTSQATIATAAASAAQQSAVLSASIGQGALNLNPGFDDYPSATVGQLPTGWVAAAGAAHYRVADPFGGYSIRVPGPAGSNAQIAQTSQQTTPVLTPNGWYVLEVDAVLNSGTWTGAGMQFRSFNAAGTLLTTYTFPLSSTPTINDSNPANTTGVLCQWRQLVQVTDATAKGVRVDFGSHLSGGGSNVAANDITFQKVLLRAATPSEIRDQTVLAPMEATVATHDTVLATHTTQLASRLERVSAGPASAKLKMTALNSSGGAASKIELESDAFSFGTSDGVVFEAVNDAVQVNGDLYVNGGKIIADTGTFMKVIGKGFGTASQFIEWFGPKMAFNLCSEANAITYVKTNGDAYFGGSLSAGALKNSIRTSATASNATAVCGPFGTNGDPIVVAVSWSYQSLISKTYTADATGVSQFNADVATFGATSSNGSDYAGSVSVTKASSSLTLSRKIGAGSYANVQSSSSTTETQSFSGTKPISGSDTGSASITLTNTISFTYTDNAGGTGDREFTATLARGYTNSTGTITQGISIVTTEE